MVLIKAIQDGNYTAFKEFYDLTHGKLFNFALKQTKDEDFAKDIVQTAYILLWEKRQTIQPKFSAFQSYLFTTTRNLVIKEYKRKIAEQELIFSIREMQINHQDSEDPTNTLIEQVKKVIESFPHKQKQVFTLVKLEGLAYKEAAQKLAIAESTVEKHIIKSMKTLHQQFS